MKIIDRIKSKFGYTLLELMIALSIITVLVTFSLYTIFSFQETARLNTDSTKVNSMIKEYQSFAKINNYGNAGSKLNIDTELKYILEFNERSINPTLCDSATLPKCISYSDTYKFEFSTTDYNFDISNSKSCKTITFNSNASSFLLKNSNSQEVDACCVMIKNVKSNDSRVIEVNKISRNIRSVQYDKNEFCFN